MFDPLCYGGGITGFFCFLELGACSNSLMGLLVGGGVAIAESSSNVLLELFVISCVIHWILLSSSGRSGKSLLMESASVVDVLWQSGVLGL